MPEQNGSALIIAHAAFSFDRGIRRNKAEDLGLEDEVEVTPDGGLVRGYGSNWRSEDARKQAMACGKEERRVRKALRRAFVKAPFDSTFIIPELGAGRKFIDNLDPPVADDVRVLISEYQLGIAGQAAEALEVWQDRVQKQLRRLPYGRGEQVSVEGLDVLASLIKCPIISDDTRGRLTELIQDARLENVTRVDFKRKLQNIDVTLAAKPIKRRAPKRKPVELGPTPVKTPKRRAKRQVEKGPKEPAAK